MGKVGSACTEMVRTMLAIGWLSGTAHMAQCVGQEKARQSGDTISSLPQEREDMGELMSGSRLYGKASAGKVFLGSKWSLNRGHSQERGCL